MLGFSAGKLKKQFTADGCYIPFRGETAKTMVQLSYRKVIKLQEGCD